LSKALSIELLAILATLGFALGSARSAASPGYHITHEVSLPGDEGWDYLAFEQGGHRLFVSHGTRVLVVDTDTLKVVGEVADTPGVHGIALAPDLGRGYISAGRSNTIVVFDLKTLARLQEITATGENPDAILYDVASHRVFSFNGRGRNVTAIDATTNTVLGTIALDAKPEFAVSDGHGHVYVNLEDRHEVAAIDPKLLSVTSVWPLTGCENPSGLAIDPVRGRLYPACANKLMAVVDTSSGKLLGTAPIGAGVDAAAFDPGTGLAYASCGEGVLTAVRAGKSGRPQVMQTVQTQRGARTMALDLATHRVFLVTANFAPAPAAAPGHPQSRPATLPGTFRLLVLEPQHAATTMSSQGAHP
jgi:DNA-binding beta-propeller fold protein YncE